jgi:hypothetical protein
MPIVRYEHPIKLIDYRPVMGDSADWWKTLDKLTLQRALDRLANQQSGER